jgi:hypothetical protein
MLTYAGSAGVRVSAYLRAYETHALKEAVGARVAAAEQVLAGSYLNLYAYELNLYAY